MCLIVVIYSKMNGMWKEQTSAASTLRVLDQQGEDMVDGS